MKHKMKYEAWTVCMNYEAENACYVVLSLELTLRVNISKSSLWHGKIELESLPKPECMK